MVLYHSLLKHIQCFLYGKNVIQWCYLESPNIYLLNSTKCSLGAQSVLWVDKAVDVWKYLQDIFSWRDIIHIFELQEIIYAFKQNDLFVTDYFTCLKILWDEQINFKPYPLCSCEEPYECGAVNIAHNYMKYDYVIRFLRGLNEQFANVKSQIMMIEPLPSINKVFSLVLQ